MPYATGTWGPEAQERSKRRLLYFHQYSKQKYLYNREKILKAYADNINGIRDRQKAHYEAHKEEIKRKRGPCSEEEKKRMQEYYTKNRQKIRQQQKEYYLKRKRTKTEKQT